MPTRVPHNREVASMCPVYRVPSPVFVLLLLWLIFKETSFFFFFNLYIRNRSYVDGIASLAELQFLEFHYLGIWDHAILCKY